MNKYKVAMFISKDLKGGEVEANTPKVAIEKIAKELGYTVTLKEGTKAKHNVATKLLLKNGVAPSRKSELYYNAEFTAI